MLKAVRAWAEPIAKALVAAVLPVVTPILVDVIADVELYVVGLLTAAVTAIGVWAVPNKAVE